MSKITELAEQFLIDKALKPLLLYLVDYVDEVEDAPIKILVMASILPTCFDYTITGPQAHAKPNIPAIKEYIKEVRSLWLNSSDNL